MELFRLFGSVLIDDKEAIEALKKVDSKGKDTGSKLGKLVKGGALVGGAIVGAAGLAGGALMGIATKSAEATDRIDKMSQKLGMSREGFQEWDYVLSQNGVSIDSMQSGMKTMTNQFDELRKGGSVATEAFGQLGLSYDDLAGKSQEEIFNTTITALQGVEDETQRAAIANDLLGRSGSELAPLLNAGAGSAEELKEKARELGLIMGDEAIDSGVKFTDTMDDVKRSFGTAFSELGVKFMPLLQKFLDWVIEHMPEIQATMDKVFSFIEDVVIVASDVFSEYLLPIIEKVVGFISKHWPTISSVVSTVFKNVMRVVGVAVDFIIGAFEGIGKFISKVKEIFNKIKDAITSPIEKAKDIISGIVGKIKDFFNFKVSLPKIKLPHFAISPKGWKIGDLLKGKIPKLGIDWYAKGAVFDKPTIFPTAAGFKGIGEAGPEAVAPISTLMDYIRTAVGEKQQAINVNFYPQNMSESELDKAFRYVNRRFGMEV